MKSTNFFQAYNKAINSLSFSPELHKLRRELNIKIDGPESIDSGIKSHPLGVSKRYKKRRITIAEAYLVVIKDLDSRNSKARLRALRLMMDASFHAKTLDLPLNTARVQMALMKDAVKNRSDRRKQLELLHDFSISSYGQHQVIRKLCNEQNIIEVPDTGKTLKDLNLGSDSHVHDTATSGRKNSTQLLIDAFIKGISELTIAYTNPDAVEMMEEALEAGKIVGIKVNIALEFSSSFAGKRFHFMALLPELKGSGDLRQYLKEKNSALSSFFEGLRANQKNRIASVQSLLDNFNKTYLKELNDEFPGTPLYHIQKLKMKDLESFMSLASVNRMHLGEFLYNSYKPILLNRVLLLRAQRSKAHYDLRHKIISEWDFKIIDGRYAGLREEYRTVSPDMLRKRFFVNPKIGDYKTVFDDLAKTSRDLNSAGCKLKVLHPLEHGLDKAMKLLEKNSSVIDFVEIYNIQDSVHREPDEILQLCRYVNELNTYSLRDKTKPFIPVCGSDATGRSPEIPGMGFILSDRIIGRNRRKYLRKHILLPSLVTRMILSEGKPIDLQEKYEGPAIVCMGKISEMTFNKIGDEPEKDPIPLSRAIRYLNNGLMNAVLSAIGFLVAYNFIGPVYACVWIGITGIRNMLADIFSTRGLRFSDWKLRSVNYRNVAQSLFWTGFSVPILSFVKSQFDVLWIFAATGTLYNFAKFFFISTANGLYLASHNTLRGFDRKVIRANFFRSVISWPFASLFAPLGGLLGVPSIVQAKFWSDVVAGFIEGGGKYFKTLCLSRRDIEEIVPRIIKGESDEKYSTILDLLFFFQEEPRTRTSLRKFLSTSHEDPKQKKRAAKHGKKKNQVETDLYYQKLLSVFYDDRLFRDLIDYILTQYGSEVSADLTYLVTEEFPLFRDWLKNHCGPPLPEKTRAVSAFSSQPGNEACGDGVQVSKRRC